jgi:hypothetical protein
VGEETVQEDGCLLELLGREGEDSGSGIQVFNLAFVFGMVWRRRRRRGRSVFVYEYIYC